MTERNQITAIQVLRGLAAVMVVFHHFAMSVSAYHRSPSVIATSGLGDLGAAGVDIFFVISGFIMCFTRKTESSGVSGAFDFLRKRFIRIYPLYWFWTTVLLLMWGLSIALKSEEIKAPFVVSSYLLWPSAKHDGTMHPLLDQGWTLSFEIYFYLFFAVAIAFGFRRMLLIFLIAVFGALALIADPAYLPSGAAYLFRSPLIVEFLLGVAAAQLVLRLRGVGLTLRSRCSTVLLIAGPACLLATTLLSPDQNRVLVWGVPSFMIVVGAALNDFAHPVRSKFPIFLGDASYSIYLTHGFFTLAAGTVMKKVAATQSVPPDAIVLIGSVVTVILGSLTYPMVEKPLLKFVRGLFHSAESPNALPVRSQVNAGP